MNSAIQAVKHMIWEPTRILTSPMIFFISELDLIRPLDQCCVWFHTDHIRAYQNALWVTYLLYNTSPCVKLVGPFLHQLPLIWRGYLVSKLVSNSFFLVLFLSIVTILLMIYLICSRWGNCWLASQIKDSVKSLFRTEVQFSDSLTVLKNLIWMHCGLCYTFYKQCCWS